MSQQNTSATQSAQKEGAVFERHPLFRLLAINLLIGIVSAIVLVSALLVTDTFGLWTLISKFENPLVPLSLLLLGFIVLMASLSMGVAVMSMPYDDDDDDEPRGGRKIRVADYAEPALVPVPVRVSSRR